MLAGVLGQPIVGNQRCFQPVIARQISVEALQPSDVYVPGPVNAHALLDSMIYRA